MHICTDARCSLLLGEISSHIVAAITKLLNAVSCIKKGMLRMQKDTNSGGMLEAG